MICRYCGGELPDSAKFCENCGADLAVDISAQQPGQLTVALPPSTPLNNKRKKMYQQEIIFEDNNIVS